MVVEMYGENGWGGNPAMMIMAPVRGTLSGRLCELLNAEGAEMRRSQRTHANPDEGRLNQISGEVVDGAIHVHRELGPGLLESTYETCLTYELRERRLTVRTQVPVPIVYKGIRLEQGYRIDMLVEEAVVVEIKTIVRMHPVHEAQLLTHLKHSGHRLGLLLNFNELLMRDGIKRIANGL